MLQHTGKNLFLMSLISSISDFLTKCEEVRKGADQAIYCAKKISTNDKNHAPIHVPEIN